MKEILKTATGTSIPVLLSSLTSWIPRTSGISQLFYPGLSEIPAPTSGGLGSDIIV